MNEYGQKVTYEPNQFRTKSNNSSKNAQTSILPDDSNKSDESMDNFMNESDENHWDWDEVNFDENNECCGRFIPYKLPNYFLLRISGLILLLIISLILIILILLFLPITIGRLVFLMVGSDSNPKPDILALIFGFIVLGSCFKLASW